MTTETVESRWSRELREDVEIRFTGQDEWGNDEYAVYLDQIQFARGTMEQVEDSLALYALFVEGEVDTDGF